MDDYDTVYIDWRLVSETLVNAAGMPTGLALMAAGYLKGAGGKVLVAYGNQALYVPAYIECGQILQVKIECTASNTHTGKFRAGKKPRSSV